MVRWLPFNLVTRQCERAHLRHSYTMPTKLIETTTKFVQFARFVSFSFFELIKVTSLLVQWVKCDRTFVTFFFFLFLEHWRTLTNLRWSTQELAKQLVEEKKNQVCSSTMCPTGRLQQIELNSMQIDFNRSTCHRSLVRLKNISNGMRSNQAYSANR